jgi:hypothetical protein
MLLSETRVTDANGRLLTDCRSQTSPLFSGVALGILPTMARRKIAHNKPQRPRIGKRRLGEMIEAATVDSNSESEQLMGWLMMIGDNLAVPFETTVLGVPVVVERIDLNYEFQAIDRPLIEREMTELRAHSTRARITPTSFVNDYSWGSFKGDEDTWMERYFDAFLYLANWGTHVLKLRLPAYLLDAKTARMYCVGEQVSVREKKGNVIVSFVSEDEEGDDWVEGAGRLSSLISVRVSWPAAICAFYTSVGSSVCRMATSTTTSSNLRSRLASGSSVLRSRVSSSFCGSVPISSPSPPRRARLSYRKNRRPRKCTPGSRSSPTLRRTNCSHG